MGIRASTTNGLFAAGEGPAGEAGIDHSDWPLELVSRGPSLSRVPKAAWTEIHKLIIARNLLGQIKG